MTAAKVCQRLASVVVALAMTCDVYGLRWGRARNSQTVVEKGYYDGIRYSSMPRCRNGVWMDDRRGGSNIYSSESTFAGELERMDQADKVSEEDSVQALADSLTKSAEILPSEDVRNIFQNLKSGVEIDQSNSFLATAHKKGDELMNTVQLPYGKNEAWRHANVRSLFAGPVIRSPTLSHTLTSPPSDSDNAPTTPRTVPAAPTSSDFHVSDAMRALVAEYTEEGCEASCLVFVDGVLCNTLSNTDALPAGVTAGSVLGGVPESAQQAGFLDIVPDAKELPRDSYGSDALTALNLANVGDVGVVHVAQGVQCETPLQLLFVTRCSVCHNALSSSCCSPSPASSPSSKIEVEAGIESESTGTTGTVHASFPRVHLTLEAGALLKIKQSFVSACPSKGQGNKGALVCSNTLISVGAGAVLEHTYAQELSVKTNHLEVLNADIHANSSYELIVVQEGARIGRVNTHLNILDSGSNCTLNGVSMPGERQSQDLHSSITHFQPSAISRQQQRNAVAGRGQAVFKGRIRIPQAAQLTDSDQLCRSLMLGEKARVIAMPTLEITADNVVCSHGASVTDLDENSMFYLASRGINRPEARKMLLRSFAFEVLGNAILGKRAAGRVQSKLESMNSASDDLLIPQQSSTGYQSI